MARLFYSLILLQLLFAMSFFATVARAESKFYFHWGSFDGNRDLLQDGGATYDTNDPLSANAVNGAAINEKVLQRTRDWYVNAGKADVAGAGFYMSSDPFDSMTFGSDLLVVEVDTPAKLSDVVVQTIGENFTIKNAANKALVNKDFSQLNLINRYSSTWHVVSRAPKLGEATIHFRHPSAEDVSQIWNQLLKDKTPLLQLFFLSELASHIESSTKGTSPSAKVFLHRLLFDHGEQSLEQLLAKEPDLLTKNTSAFSEFRNIVEVYHKIIPDDPRTKKLAMLFLQDLSKQKDGIGQLNFALDLIKNFSSEENKKISPAMEFFFKEDPNFYMVSKLRLYEKLENYLSAEIKKSWSANLSTILPEKLYKDATSLQLPLFSRYLPKQKVDEIASLALRMRMQRPDDHPEEITAFLSYLRREDKALWEKTLEDGIQDLSAEGGHLRMRVMAWLEMGFDDPEAGAVITKNLGPMLDHLFKEFDDIFDLQASLQHYRPNSKRFEQFVLKLSKDYPQFSHSLLNSLSNLDESKSLDGMHVRVSVLAEKIKQQAQGFDELKSEYKNLPYTRRQKLSFEDFKTDWMRLNENIPGSPEYSKLSRSFLLVDPILVSEDMRTMNATHPQQRFNEKYYIDNEEHIQPAWENFNYAWNKLGLAVLDEKNGASVAPALFDANTHMLMANVDGTPQADLNHNASYVYDRKRYEIKISQEDWARLGLAKKRQDMEKFFEINENGGVYSLKFLSAEELSAKNPELKLYLSTNEDKSAVASKICRYINDEVFDAKTPLEKATKILYLFPRLHPFANGNGRLARAWAALELKNAGLPMPLGLTTNDFPLSEEEVELELRRALALGKLWEKDLTAAQAAGIKPEGYFQNRFKGSALEGLLHVNPEDATKKAKYVAWLESLEEAPSWSQDFLQEYEAALHSEHVAGRSAGAMSEIEREKIAQTAWSAFDKKNHTSAQFIVPEKPLVIQDTPLPKASPVAVALEETKKNQSCPTLFGKIKSYFHAK